VLDPAGERLTCRISSIPERHDEGFAHETRLATFPALACDCCVEFP
jgi:hypothetical protein